ncbi:MAG: hypothetical protein HKN14_11760 [Marinicaulis sp.]|nr:hypothetical protein [Marinicaulis sp.]NNE41578.1 hypothetical protein [Marinicaulis sp.]NNL89665.1 hypothetical protein [Marinicaulis sp.]
MKFTINIDCTPQEARTFFGMPDVEPMNQMVMGEMMKRAKDSMDTLADPERFVANMMAMGGKGMEQFQSMMGAAMAGGGKSGKK